MPVDVQLFFPLDEVPLTTVQAVILDGVPKLALVGKDFNSAKAVYVNERRTEDFIVYDKTHIITALPQGVLVTDPLTSLRVLSRSLTVTDRSRIQFELGKGPEMIRGILRLLQLFTKLFLTTQGTNIFAPDEGGGFLRYVRGVQGGPEARRDIISGAVVSASTTERYIIKEQARDPRLPPEERLRSARIASTSYDAETETLGIFTEVTSHSNRVGRAYLEV